MAGGGSSAEGGGAGSSDMGGSGVGGCGAGSSDVGGSCMGGCGDGSSAVGGGSSVDGDGAEGSPFVGDDDGTSVVVLVGASLGPGEDTDGSEEDASFDDVVGASSSEAEEEYPPPRVGVAEVLLSPGPVVDGPAATSTDLPDGQGVTELAVAIPSRKLRRMVFSPSVPSSVWIWSSTCSTTLLATRPTASSGLAIGLSESGASQESSETATTAATTTPAPASA